MAIKTFVTSSTNIDKKIAIFDWVYNLYKFRGYCKRYIKSFVTPKDFVVTDEYGKEYVIQYK